MCCSGTHANTRHCMSLQAGHQAVDACHHSFIIISNHCSVHSVCQGSHCHNRQTAYVATRMPMPNMPYAVLCTTGCSTLSSSSWPAAWLSISTGSSVGASCRAAACACTGTSSAAVSMGPAPLLEAPAAASSAADASPTAPLPSASPSAAPCASAAPLPLGTCRHVRKLTRCTAQRLTVPNAVCQ